MRSGVARYRFRAPAALLLLLLGLAGAGCVGGQSGAEDLCDDNASPAERMEQDATYNTAIDNDEDGGVEDDGGAKEFTTDDPEIQNGPIQCSPPPEGDEY